MKRFIVLLLILLSLCGLAYGESPATPTDLIEIEDDDWGEIEIQFERQVYIDMAEEGDTIVLTAILVNFKEDDKIKFQWQYALELPYWLDITGATEQIYTFTLDKDNYSYLYRVLVELEGLE